MLPVHDIIAIGSLVFSGLITIIVALGKWSGKQLWEARKALDTATAKEIAELKTFVTTLQSEVQEVRKKGHVITTDLQVQILKLDRVEQTYVSHQKLASDLKDSRDEMKTDIRAMFDDLKKELPEIVQLAIFRHKQVDPE